MYTRLFILCAIVAFAAALEYPAGVHPAVCPNYPYCDLSALARHTPAGIPIPEWELNPALLPTAPVVLDDSVQSIPIAELERNPSPLPIAPVVATPDHLAKYPAGVHPAVCPNYPYCDLSTLARHTPAGIPIPEWELNPALHPTVPVVRVADYVAKYPAGVHPSVCPDYPYCF